jgi:transposase-like protein
MSRFEQRQKGTQMSTKQESEKKPNLQDYLPSGERIVAELSSAKSMDDFFGKDGIFSRLFAKTMEAMLEAEMTEHLGYDAYEAKGRNSGNSRNGHRKKKLRTSSGGELEIEVPRDRNSEFEPQIVRKYETTSNELEDKIIAMYAKGMSTRDITDTLHEMYGMEVSAQTITNITNKVLPLVEAWQNRPLESVYPIIYLDGIYFNLRKEHKVESRAIYVVLGVTLEGYKEVLGHWVSDGAEGASFWLSVVTDMKNRGVQDVFIACIDGLAGFKDAIRAVFPQVEIQRCIVHQIRNSLKYVVWADRKEFTADLRSVYQAPTREAAEENLLALSEKWGSKYAMAIRSWENNWNDLATFFDYTPEIRRLIYTTNPIEGYNRQLRKVTKSKATFSTYEAVRKLLWLVHQNIVKKWTMPIANWAMILNQLAIRFEGRFPV